MKIEVLYIEDCPHHLPAVDLIRTILREEGLPVEIFEIDVKDAAAAKRLMFFGSPTIRIDGIDIEPDACSVTATGLACRRYPGGLPSGETIRTAIREALHRTTKCYSGSWLRALSRGDGAAIYHEKRSSVLEQRKR